MSASAFSTYVSAVLGRDISHMKMLATRISTGLT